mgnify:CR=1 FL=1
MSTEQILEAIRILTEVINVNKGWFGNERAVDEANDKIRELMKKLK